MKTAADYRIERIEKATVNEKQVKTFLAYVNQAPSGFVFLGAFTAPVKTADKNLWLIANESDTGSIE